MSVAPETSWSYDLNPLVRHCVNSRVLAVWQALAEVARGPDSFFFTPSAELYFAQRNQWSRQERSGCIMRV